MDEYLLRDVVLFDAGDDPHRPSTTRALAGLLLSLGACATPGLRVDGPEDAGAACGSCMNRFTAGFLSAPSSFADILVCVSRQEKGTSSRDENGTVHLVRATKSEFVAFDVFHRLVPERGRHDDVSDGATVRRCRRQRGSTKIATQKRTP